MSSSEDYYTAEEDSSDESEENILLSLGFYLHTTSSGFMWYLPISISVYEEAYFK